MTVKEMTELKPCPFCGGKAKLRNNGIAECRNKQNGDLITRWEVVCTNCGVKKDGGASEYFFRDDETLGLVNKLLDGRTKAIEAWNRRAHE